MREFAKTLHFRSICCSSSDPPGTNSKILSFQEAHWGDLSQTDVKVVKKVKSDGVPAVSLLPDGLPTLLVTLPHLLLPAQPLQSQGRRRRLDSALISSSETPRYLPARQAGNETKKLLNFLPGWQTGRLRGLSELCQE